MNPRHAAALALVSLLTLALIEGCTFPYGLGIYYPDPSIHLAGWKCPDADKMSHVVGYWIPPCAWILNGALFESCKDKEIANLNEARGCVPEPGPTVTATPTPTATPTN